MLACYVDAPGEALGWTVVMSPLHPGTEAAQSPLQGHRTQSSACVLVHFHLIGFLSVGKRAHLLVPPSLCYTQIQINSCLVLALVPTALPHMPPNWSCSHLHQLLGALPKSHPWPHGRKWQPLVTGWGGVVKGEGQISRYCGVYFVLQI